MLTFDFHDMPICGDDGLTADTTMVDVEVDIEVVEPADPGSDTNPPWPAVFDIKEVRLIHREKRDLLGPEIITVKLSEVEFATFFAPAADIINNAYEWASEQ